MNKELKFRTSYSAKINPLVSKDVDKYLALAAESNFKKYLPKNINFDEKIDCLAFAGEAFVANRLNSNGDGVGTEEAIRIAGLFPFSFVDNEHERDQIVGVLLSASFAEFGTGKELSLDDVKNTKSPFSVVLGGLLWRIINPKFVKAIEESTNPNSEYFNKFFLSWELAYASKDLILIDKDKFNFEDGEIITDQDKIIEIEGKMSSNSIYGDKKVGTIIKDDAIPLAVGIVETPAAHVKSIVTSASENDKIEIKSSSFDINKQKEENILSAINELTKQLEKTDSQMQESTKKFQDITSQIKKDNVKPNNSNKKQEINIMEKIKSVKDITDERLQMEETKASHIVEFIDSEVNRISQEYEQKRDEVQNKLKEAEKKSQDLEENLNTAQKELNTVKEELTKLVKANEEKEAQEAFTARMTHFDSEYKLDDKTRNIVANRIKGLNDEDYKVQKEELETLLASLKIIKHNEEDKDCGCESCSKKRSEAALKQSQASADEPKKDDPKDTPKDEGDSVVDEAIKNAQQTNAGVPNTGAVEETLDEKYTKAFGKEAWEVKKRKR